MEYVLVTTMVVGMVQCVKALFDRDFRTAIIIVLSALIGAVCGFLAIEGLDVATGVVVGLAASGVVTVASYVSVPARTVR